MADAQHYSNNIAAIVGVQKAARRWLAVRQRQLLLGIEQVEESLVLVQEQHAYIENVRWEATSRIQRLGRAAQERWVLSGWSTSSPPRRFNPTKVPMSNWVTHIEGERTVAIQHDAAVYGTSTALTTRAESVNPITGALIVPTQDGWVQTKKSPKKKLGSLVVPKQRHHTNNARDTGIEWGATGQLRPQALRQRKAKPSTMGAPEVDIRSLYTMPQRQLWRLSLDEVDSLYAGAMKAQERTLEADEQRRLRHMGLASTVASPKKGHSKRHSRIGAAGGSGDPMDNTTSTIHLPTIFQQPTTRHVTDAEAARREELIATEARRWSAMVFSFSRGRR